MTLKVEQTADLTEPHAIRRRVFIEEQGFTEAEEWDDLDSVSVHLVVRDGGAPVASARLIQDGGTGKIGRICVLARARGTGLGAKLVRAGMDLLRERGAPRAVLDAQTRAMGFYEKLGFTAEGADFDDGGVPHRRMTCPL